MAAWQSGTRGEAAGALACARAAPPLPLHCGLGTHRSADNEIRRSRLAASRPALAKSQDQPLPPSPPERPVTYACDNDRRPPLKQQPRGGSRSAEAFSRRSPRPASCKRRRKTHNSGAFHTKSSSVVKSISHYL